MSDSWLPSVFVAPPSRPRPDLPGLRRAVRFGWIVGLGLALAGCPRPPAPRSASSVAGLKLPPLPAWQAVAPTSRERRKDALQVFQALAPGSPARQALRRQLTADRVKGLAAALHRGQGLAGVERFETLVSLHRSLLSAPPQGGLAAATADLRKVALQVFRTYRPRGQVQPVLLALAVLQAVDAPRRTRWAREFDRVVSWLGEIEDPLLGHLKAYESAAEQLDRVFRRWPSPFVRHALQVLVARQYVSLRPLAALPKLPNQRQFKQALASLQEFAWQRLRLLILEGNSTRLSRFLEGLKADALADRRLLGLATAALAKDAGAGPWISLAEAYAPKWPEFARRLCQRAARLAPKDANPLYCLGRLALSSDQTLLALRYLDRAVRLAPNSRQTWELFASTYLDRLVSLLSQERLAQVRKEVRFLERFYGAARRLWPGRPLKASLADVYFMLGRGLYNEGRIDQALATLRKAIKLKPTPQAFLQLAEVNYWRGEYARALELFADAHRRLKGGSAWRAYWELRTAPLIARTRMRLAETLRRKARLASDLPTRVKLERAAKTEEASATLLRTRALHMGKLLIANFSSAKLRAEILVHVGWIFWQLGRQRLAIQSFDTALDEAPERSSTYVDVISFLVMRGRFDEALDAYHRALARPGISEYLKAYCTFWILDLGRRLKVDPDRLGLAEVFLKHLRGHQWYHQLARFYRGEVTYAQLLPKAKTKGQRAELEFYDSMRLVRKGRLAEARRLWKRIVDSEMMAFFEYKMVRRYLEHGVPMKQQPLKTP